MSNTFLRVVNGPRQGMNVPLHKEQPLLIGRNRGDLLLDDPLISGAHCRIVSKQGHYVLQDLGSTNGTLVNGRRVQDAVLKPGAEVRVGNTKLILFGGDAEDERPTTTDGSVGHMAWLLEDELVAGDAPGVRALGQMLRLPRGFDAEVEVVSGPDAGERFSIKMGTLAMGRKQGQIPLADPEVSRRHAFIEVFGRDMVFLRDVASTNGTYHNGVKIDTVRLSHGDMIGVGRSVLRFHRTDEAH